MTSSIWPEEWPERSERGDENLCAHCAERKGTVYDDEWRLVCSSCAKTLKRQRKKWRDT